jgi:hypothetical protein
MLNSKRQIETWRQGAQMHDTSFTENYDQIFETSRVIGNSNNPSRESSQSRSIIDHLHNANPMVQKRLGDYFQKTRRGSKEPRDTTLTGASKELERQSIKVQRMFTHLNTIMNYRNEQQ